MRPGGISAAWRGALLAARRGLEGFPPAAPRSPPAPLELHRLVPPSPPSPGPAGGSPLAVGREFLGGQENELFPHSPPAVSVTLAESPSPAAAVLSPVSPHPRAQALHVNPSSSGTSSIFPGSQQCWEGWALPGGSWGASEVGMGGDAPQKQRGAPWLLTGLLALQGPVAQRVPAWGQRVPGPGVTLTRGAVG